MDAEIALLFLFVILPLVVLVFVLPIVAMVKASRAKSRVIRLEDEVETLRLEVERLHRTSKAPVAKMPIAAAAPEMSDEPLVAVRAAEDSSPASAYVFKSDVVGPEAPADAEDIGAAASPEPTSDEAATPVEAASEEAAMPETETPSVPPRPEHPGTSIEERIGVVWFTRIGAAVGMVVAGWFFKYMVDNDWIGPWGRIALGAAAGGVVLGLGEWFYRRKRTHPLFNQGLLGLGLALLLITAYASFGFYHLVPSGAAFAVVALLCFFGDALAHYHRSEVILVFSLLAAFLNPVLLSTGVDRPVALFSYLLVMTGAAYVIAVIHGFVVATFTAAGGAFLLFGGWYGKYFDIHPAPPLGYYDEPSLNTPGAYFALARRFIPILFSVLFVVEWVAAALLHLRKARRSIGTILVRQSNAIIRAAAVAAILYDRPLLLGIALLVYGVLFAGLLIRFDLTEWLFLTMTASFVILACLKNELVVRDLLPLLTVTGLLSSLYFSIFLRAAVRADRRPSPFIQWLIAGSGARLVVHAARSLSRRCVVHRRVDGRVPGHGRGHRFAGIVGGGLRPRICRHGGRSNSL